LTVVPDKKEPCMRPPPSPLACPLSRSNVAHAALFLSLLLFLYNEFFCFLLSGFACSLSKAHPDDLVVLVVTDMHVLGKRRSALDSWWTTYGLRKAFVAVTSMVKPDVTLVLGDHIDEGGAASAEEFTAYANAFRAVTRHRKGVFIASVVGNHDFKLPEQLARFEKEFGPSNALRRVGRYEFVSVNAQELGRQGSPTDRFVDAFRASNGSHRVLLSHMPLFRKDDSGCGQKRLREAKGVTYLGPMERNVENVDVLSALQTDRLLRQIKPAVVLSGHTHAQCQRMLASPAGSDGNDNNVAGRQGILDLTVPAFSW
jgi:predicted phosphodiesterase